MSLLPQHFANLQDFTQYSLHRTLTTDVKSCKSLPHQNATNDLTIASKPQPEATTEAIYVWSHFHSTRRVYPTAELRCIQTPHQRSIRLDVPSNCPRGVPKTADSGCALTKWISGRRVD